QTDLGMALPVSVAGTTTGDPSNLSSNCGTVGGQLSTIPTAGGLVAPDAEYQWTPPRTAIYAIDTFGSSFDTIVSVRDATCAGPELTCNDDAIGLQSEVHVPLSAGQTVIVVVDGYGRSNGPYALHIDRFPSCGDGVLDPGEQCDDGNRTGGDGC